MARNLNFINVTEVIYRSLFYVKHQGERHLSMCLAFTQTLLFFLQNIIIITKSFNVIICNLIYLLRNVLEIRKKRY